VQKTKLLDLIISKLRVRHYSLHTEKSYISWIKRFIHFHNKRHPNDMGANEILAFIRDIKMHHSIYIFSTASGIYNLMEKLSAVGRISRE
jgi:hypothetical protein